MCLYNMCNFIKNYCNFVTSVTLSEITFSKLKFCCTNNTHHEITNYFSYKHKNIYNTFCIVYVGIFMILFNAHTFIQILKKFIISSLCLTCFYKHINLPIIQNYIFLFYPNLYIQCTKQIIKLQ